MRVGTEGVGGAPYDATAAARGGEARPDGEITGSAAGFLQLLALLQGAATELPPEGLPDDAADDGSGDDPADGIADAAAAVSGATAIDQAATIAGVVVTLSSNAVTGAGDPPDVVGCGSGSSGSAGAQPPGRTVGTPRAQVVGAALDAALVAPGGADGTGQAARKIDAVPIAEAAASVAEAGAAQDPLAAARQVLARGQRPGRVQSGAAAVASAPQQDASDATATVEESSTGDKNKIERYEGGSVAEPVLDDPAPSGRRHALTRVAAGVPEAAAGDGDDERASARATAPRPGGAAPVKSFAAIGDHAPDAAALARAPSLEPAPSARDELTGVREARPAEPATTSPQTMRASLRGGEGATLPSWIEHLTNPQRLALSRRAESLTFDLEPNGLGRIEVRLSLGRDGVRAQVFAEHEHTRALLTNQQPALASAFERNDLRLESFLVDLGLGTDGERGAHGNWEDMTAFDQIGLVSGTVGEDDAGETPSPITTLLSVRA